MLKLLLLLTLTPSAWCILNDPVAIYLSEMCTPNVANATWRGQYSAVGVYQALASSPFPCEAQLYLQTSCTANGTSEIDFLAEQQCLCNGDFFEAMQACANCYIAHGDDRRTPDFIKSRVMSLSAAECTPSPPYQPFASLTPQPVPDTSYLASLRAAPPLTLGIDRFPNNTEVSNYLSPTRTFTPGEITGSAMGRVLSWTNFDGVRYTPTRTPTITSATSQVVTSTSSTALTSTSTTESSASSAAPASTTGASNDGSKVGASLGSGWVAVGLGFLLMIYS